ncbi:hypothetical protein [Chromobacterium violaceum]|uniref:hypothetical protein n=1 Tax=Chromobacterium violaceum TaxID=536 RepID=UPI001056DB85|nr:hypothetical protein [Chromobacterium violaceum]MBA8736664.1 hypothetical protein [Chromobacterium violaceum]MBP4045615.1 hypothetical protein [Chromobacterium violaceum]MBP4050795.1 hypothetical protein [Chromobacterium violaceum]MBT2869323.1 hypothetical protein [Chromobacterium violaceum]MBX9268202.1 hypothetical protein [Chromobacterium violaceum]
MKTISAFKVSISGAIPEAIHACLPNCLVWQTVGSFTELELFYLKQLTSILHDIKEYSLISNAIHHFGRVDCQPYIPDAHQPVPGRSQPA